MIREIREKGMSICKMDAHEQEYCEDASEAGQVPAVYEGGRKSKLDPEKRKELKIDNST